MFLGGIIGLVIMRFAANAFVKLLHKRPSLETAAFIIVGWVGVKLAVHTLAHPNVGMTRSPFPRVNIMDSNLLGCVTWNCVIAYFVSGKKGTEEEKQVQEV